MKKKLALLAVGLGLALSLTGCNKTIIDLMY